MLDMVFLVLMVVLVDALPGKRLSKFSMAQSDLQRLQEGSTKTQSDDLLVPWQLVRSLSLLGSFVR